MFDLFDLFGRTCKRKQFLSTLGGGPQRIKLLASAAWASRRDVSDEEVLAAIWSVPMHFAAPAAASIGTPAGLHLRDGYSCKIVCNRLTTFSLWEKTVQPPALTVGEEIDLTTMRNAAVTTKWPQTLHDVGPLQVVCGYDPNVWAQARATVLGQNDNWTVQYPDGSTLAFFGFLKSLEPAALQRGTFPEATVTIVVTNLDSSFAEQVPVYTNVTGS